MRLLPAVLPNALAALLALSACSPRNPQIVEVNAALPLDRLVARQPVVLSLGRDWNRGKASDWVFRGVTFLHLGVLEPPTEPLVIEMAGSGRTANYRFEVRLDGEELFPDPVALPAAGWSLRLAPESIPPGVHEIRLRRIYSSADIADGPLNHNNEIDAIRWRLGSQDVAIDPADLATLRHLDDFLSHGLVGAEAQKRAGLLFVGSQTTAIETGGGPGRELATVVENLSKGPARFVARGAGSEVERTVEPGASARITLALRDPSGRVELETSGESDGLYLWGAPFVHDSSGGASEGEPDTTPVLLITLDTTRRDALSPYGAPREWTPNLDRFAETATVYENAFSTAPWTLPSHASMFTGLYPSAHGAGVSFARIAAEHPTLAELFTDAGYFAAGIAGGDLASHRFGVGRGFRSYRNADRFETTGDRLTAYALEILEEQRDQPLFLFANYFDPHGPYRAPREMQERFGVDRLAQAAEGQEVWQALARSEPRGWRPVARSDVSFTPEGVAVLRALYQSEVAFLDAEVGRLFAALEEVDLYSRAIIAVVADHGELLGEHGLFGHSGRVDTELTWVPMIIKFPYQRAPLRVSELTSTVDLFPTLLRAAGLEPPPSRGLTLTLDAPAPGTSRYVFSEEHNSRVHPLNPRLRLADHVFAIQADSFRHVLFEGGARCEALVEGDWREAPCKGDTAALLTSVENSLGVRDSSDGELAGLLSREVEESLRALGYVD